MPHDQWEKIQELFEAAVDLQGAERVRYLDHACGQDAQLRAEVESLLASDGANTLAIAAAVEDAAADLVGQETHVGRRLGAWQITRELGRGGMGTVYLAVRADDHYQKQVAIKLVRGDVNAGPMLERLRSEMQILASLDHPYIARLLDGGTTSDGLPYLVMEYVDGEPIDRYCRTHQLSADQICELFCKVCEAVSYAHRNLVIHRDLKPGNILVTADGSPKLLDFGIAKLLAPTPGAAPANTMVQPLTPDYASPEQVRGDPVTTATDVYLLGTLLFELLTGKRPHRIRTYTSEEIARVVCREEVMRPSDATSGGSTTVPRKRLAGDLDNIILMALRKEPERRYPSADQFRADVERHLKGLPVVAREDTLAYRAGKFLRRHQVGVAAAALVFLSLLGGMIATERQRRRAEHRAKQLIELANRSLFDVHDAIAPLPGATEARRKLVATTLQYLDNLNQDENLDIELMKMTADGYLFLAQVQGLPFRPNLGQPEAALQNLAKAEVVAARLRQREPKNARFWMMTVGIMQTSGAILESQGKRAEAEAQYTKGLDAARRMRALKPGDRDAVVQEAVMDHQFATFLVDADPARAEDYARRETELYGRLAAANAKDTEVRNALGSSYLMLGRLAAGRGNPQQALDFYRKTVEIREALRKQDPNNAFLLRNLLVTYGRVGDALGAPFLDNTLGDTQAALESYRKAAEIAAQLHEHDPKDRLARLDLAMAEVRIGMTTPDTAEALAMLRRSAQAYEEVLAQSPKSVRERGSLAMAYEYIGRRQEPANRQAALASYRRSVQVSEAAPGAASSSDATLRAQRLASLRAMAGVLAAMGDRAGAIAAAGRAVSLAQDWSGASPQQPQMRRELAKAHAAEGAVYETLARTAAGEQRAQDLAAAKAAFDRGRAEKR